MIRLLIKVVGTTLLLYLATSHLKIADFRGAFLQYSVTTICYSFTLATTTLALRIWRWIRLCRFIGYDQSPVRLITSYLSSTLYGVTTIGRVGELWKIKHLLDGGLELNKAIAIAVFERLFDIVLLVILGSITASAWFGVTHYATLAAWVLIVSVGLLWLRKKGHVSLGWIGEKKALFNQAVDLRQMIGDLSGFFRNTRIFVEIASLSLAGWFLYFGTIAVLASGIGIELSTFKSVGVGSLSALSSAIPITWNGIGLRGSITRFWTSVAV